MKAVRMTVLAQVESLLRSRPQIPHLLHRSYTAEPRNRGSFHRKQHLDRGSYTSILSNLLYTGKSVPALEG